jgi:hypothetical protein
MTTEAPQAPDPAGHVADVAPVPELTAHDRRAIADLIHAYCRHLDAGAFDAVAALFEHASFGSTTHAHVRRGSKDVRHMYDAVIVYSDGTPRTQHCISNLVISPDGAGARAESTFVVLQQVPGDVIHTVLAGEYRDRFVRDSARGWAFAARVVHPHLQGDLARHMRRV